MSRAVFVWIMLSCIWGSTWMLIKVGLADVPPLSYAGMRFAVAFVPMALITWLKGLPLPRSRGDLQLVAVSGFITFTVTYGLVYWAEVYISSGLASLLFATFPLFGLFIAHRSIPDERLGVGRFVGTVLGIVGVGVIFSDQFAIHGLQGLLGGIAVVVSAALAAWADVLIKSRGGHMHPVSLTAGQLFVGAVPLLVLGALFEGNLLQFEWSALSVFATLYLALVGTALAFGLFYWLIKNIAVTKAMLITFVSPVIAVALGVVLLDERLTWRIFVGGAAIIVGLRMTLRP